MASSPCSSVCKSNENIQLHEAKYIWVIDNFSAIELDGNDLISPVFSAVTNSQVKWHLKVNPNGVTDARNFISFYVHLSPDSMPGRIFAKYTASVLNWQQGVCQTRCIVNSGNVHEFIRDTGWGKTKFFEKTSDFRNTILDNDKLTIICSVTFSPTKDAFRISNDTVLQLYPEKPAYNIAEKFEMFLENHELADIVLCVKGKEYPAHKVILAAQSPVFAAMFKHGNLKENETNRIEIEDMNEEVVSEMLRYIYTGKCENFEKLADGLLAAADKYDLGRLKMICAESLYKTLSVDNAANILTLADLHCVEKLKSEVIKFMAARFAAVLNTTNWKNLLVSHPELIDEVCQAVADRLPPSNEGMVGM